MSLALYVITYTDETDHGCPEFTWRTRAHDTEHARERFFEAEDSDGWKILKIERKKTE